MAECYIKCEKSQVNSELFDDIERINTNYSPGEPPKIPLLALLMREAGPRGVRVSEVDMSYKRTEKRLYASHSDGESWQGAYLEQDPICSCQPTATTALSPKDRPKSPVVVSKMCLTRRELEHEIAKHKLIELFRGRFTYEDLWKYFCKGNKEPSEKRGSKEKGRRGEQEEKKYDEKKDRDDTDDNHHHHDDDVDDDDNADDGDDSDDDENIDEEKDQPPKKRKKKPPPKHQDQSILKNPMKDTEVPRVVKPYEVPLDNQNGGVDFFPGKPRLAQRYRAEDINQARKRKPIVDEVDDRFRLKSSH